MLTKDHLSFLWEKALSRVGKRLGYEIKPLLVGAAAPIDVFSLAVRDLISRQPGIFFVQIGAHDGRSYDPLSGFVRKHHWRGLLVEPQPEVFARLKKNYEAEPQLLFENAAIAEPEGTLTLHRFVGADPSDHASMLASAHRHYLQFNGDGHRGKMESIDVPAISLNTLFAKHGVGKVDIFQVDTEGFDFAIICMLDFERFKPALIHFESNFLNRAQKERCAALLARHGYAMLGLGVDTVAYRQPEDAEGAERLAASKIAVT